MPVLAIALAIGGAFASQAQVEESAVVPGYISVNMPCDTKIQCSSIPGPACTAPNGQHAFGKQSANVCTLPLYRL